jgi:hypothetical protein
MTSVHTEFRATRGDSVEAALRDAAGRATLAPSIHNTQPWRFVVGAGRLDLYADLSRAVPAIDPTGRQLTISCGAALFGARVALAAAGFDAITTMLPNQADPTLLASLIVSRSTTAFEETAARLDAAAEDRHSNRRQFGPELVPESTLDVLTHAAQIEGAWLQQVHYLEDRVTVATLTQRAEVVQVADPKYAAELARWTTEDPDRLDGIPLYAVPRVTAAAQDDIPIRDFDTYGTGQLPEATHSRLDQSMLVLGTMGDGRRDWLIAGQALGRVLLELTSAGFQATILSQVTEVALTRAQLRQELRLDGPVQLLLRAGIAPPTAATPRRPLSDVIA